jgi:hypothetical protein
MDQDIRDAVYQRAGMPETPVGGALASPFATPAKSPDSGADDSSPFGSRVTAEFTSAGEPTMQPWSLEQHC